MINRDLLKQVYKSKGYTQSTFAKTIGMNENTLAGKMYGKTDFNCKEVSKIGYELSLSYRDMIRIFFSEMSIYIDYEQGVNQIDKNRL